MLSIARRLLLIPAAVLVMLGAPAFALGPSPAPPPRSTEVRLGLPDGAAPGARAQAGVPADLVGVKWTGDTDAQFKIEVLRGNSGRWDAVGTFGGDDLGPDAGSPDARAALRARDGANISEPVWVKGAADVRVTVVRGTVAGVAVEAVTSANEGAPGGSAGALGFSVPAAPDGFGYAIALVVSGGVLAAIALGWAPWRSRRQLAVVAVLAVVALTACTPMPPPSPNPAVAPQPAITLRSSWGPDLPWNPSADCAGGPQYSDDVNFTVVHHTVNSNTYAAGDSRAMVRAIWSYHVNTLGYCDIAYNFIVDNFGQIFEGRQGGTDRPVIGAHTGGFNRDSSGAALLGNFTSVQPPAAAWNALVDLLAWKLSVHTKNPADGFTATSAGYGARWPAGTTVSFPNRIVNHRDLWPTACPGDAFAPRLDELRTAVQPKVGW
ncbi:MAG: N-acetylmuramoyl-L-alanine amidase [Actinomycetota bacterium]